MLALILGSALASTTIQVESMTVDGQEVRELECELEKGGLFAAAAVVGALAKQKGTLDACMPSGGAARVAWVWAAGSVKSASVSQVSDDRHKACVTEALRGMGAPMGGSCKALLLIGPAAAAKEAAERLAPATE